MESHFHILNQVLELVCAREAGAVFEAGGLPCALCFIREHGARVHRDTLHSAMAVVTRLCGKVEPQDKALPDCVEALSVLLRHEDAHVADGALRCFASLADRFSRRGTDPAPLASNGLVSELLYRYIIFNMTIYIVISFYIFSYENHFLDCQMRQALAHPLRRLAAIQRHLRHPVP